MVTRRDWPQNLRDFWAARNGAPKPEPNEPEVPKNEEREDIEFGGAFQPPPPPQYTSYRSASDIAYTPEAALKEVLKMVKTLDDSVKTLALAKSRKTLWENEIREWVIVPDSLLPFLINFSTTQIKKSELTDYAHRRLWCHRGWEVIYPERDSGR